MTESGNDIRYLTREQIDTDRWDSCIRRAVNGLIYARSYYLDAMAKNWSALVMNDYETVMPLTWNRKYTIRYLYQPPFTAQLGIFSILPITEPVTLSFLTRCQRYFRFCELHLNQANRTTGLPVRANYIVDLGHPYNEIRKGYRKDLIGNLKKSEPDSLLYGRSPGHQAIIDLYKTQYGKRFRHISPGDFARFSGLCADLLHRQQLQLRQVLDKKSGDLLAAAVFLQDEKRIYNIMQVILPEGRERNANPFLLDQLIREFSENKTILDFEGSEIAGIAEFYRKFGGRAEPYPFFRFNHLPFPLRLLK